MDFLKERIGVEVGFGHASFIGIDLLKCQVASYSVLDKIDVGVYVVTAERFQKFMESHLCAQNAQRWGTLQSDLGRLAHVREGQTIFATFQERDSGSDLRVGD